MHRSRFLSTAAATSGALAIPSFVRAAAPIKFGVSIRSVLYLPSLIALQADLFKKNGLDVEPVLTGGGARSAATLAAGEVDFGDLGFQHVMALRAKNQQVVAIGSTQNDVGIALMMRNGWLAEHKLENADWQTVGKQLKGAKIGTFGPGTNGESHLRYVLQKSGLTLNDVTTVAMNEQAMVAGLRQGAVDGISTFQGVIEQAEALHLARVVVATWMIPGVAGQLGSAIVARNDQLAADLGRAKAFMKAMSETLTLMTNDRSKAIALTQASIPSVDPQILKAAFEHRMRITPATPLITPERVKRSERWYADLGLLKVELPFDQLATNQYLS